MVEFVFVTKYSSNIQFIIKLIKRKTYNIMKNKICTKLDKIEHKVCVMLPNKQPSCESNRFQSWALKMQSINISTNDNTSL